MRVENEVMSVLDRARTDGPALFLVGQLERSLYTRTNKVLEAAGGKWDRKTKAHLFDGGAAERIEQILLTGSIDIPKDDFEFFPTPADVAARVIDLADVAANLRVLEPSAGRGDLIVSLRSLVFIDCIEKMPANAEHLRGLRGLDSVIEADFLTVEPTPVYDRVLMNPPFGKQADIKHVLHALRFLKPDGLLVSVMAASVTFRDNKLTTDFRALIRSRGGDIEGLPEGSFKASGTGVNTVIVTIPAGGAA